ncbi:MAG TPA: glycosyltransferase family 4 protein [Thermoanaerobaculia bacterium]|nr:glycosyltransferase family 4 protein [Thermoanaerobaculia bacterium]
MIRLVVVATHPTDHLAAYLRALAARNEVDLHVLYAWRPESDERTPPDLLEGYSWGELEEVRVAKEGPRGFRGLSVPRLDRQLAAQQADAVLATGWYSHLLRQAGRAGRRLRIPRLLRGKWNDLQVRGTYGRFRLRSVLRPFSSYLAVGRANRRLYESSGIAAARVFDAPYAVDNARFVARAAELRPHRAELRERWLVSGDDFCVVQVGALDESRRPFDVLEAIEIVRRARADIRLLVVGDGPLEAQVRERARERRLPVTFAGHLPMEELMAAYAAADALVLASESEESWGLVVNEAMASGIPAVVSDQVGCREDLVLDGETGFSFRVGDSRGLAACLASLTDDPILASAMGEAARDRVVAEYSIDRADEGTLAALDGASRSGER